MKKFLLYFCLFFSYQGFAQEVLEDSYDIRSNSRKITIVDNIKLFRRQDGNVFYSPNRDSVLLTTTIEKGSLGESKVELHVGSAVQYNSSRVPDRLVILTESGKSIVLIPLGYTYTYQLSSFKYKIEPDQLEDLKDGLIKSMKIYNSNNQWEIPLKEKNLEIIQGIFELTYSVKTHLESNT